MNVLDIFYNEVIKEAREGKVEAYFTYNILFNTLIDDKLINIENDINGRLLIPTLNIKNKNLFDDLLIEYTKQAYKFYKSNKYEELDEHDYIKTILTLLWSNATSEDFENPLSFLKKRISFLNNNINEEKNIISSLGNIYVSIKKDRVEQETPFYLNITINDNVMPMVRFGIFNNSVYIYAIQNVKEVDRDKKLNRQLYKVNDGIDLKNESDDNILDFENLKGITPSALVSATIALSFFKDLGYDNFIIPVLLPVRWNAKELMYERKLKKIEEENKEKFLQEKYAEHDKISRNLSDKFIRTFRRLEYHFDNINIYALPFIDDIDMHINVSEFTMCNNPLLEELYLSINGNRNR